MNFDLTEEQLLLKETVDRLYADTYSFEQRKTHLSSDLGWSQQVWQSLAELGLLGLCIEERFGGFGGNATDTQIVMEAIGKHLALEPFLSTAVIGAMLIQRAGTDEQKSELLPKIAAGALQMAFAHSEPAARFVRNDVRTRARKDGNGWIINGAKELVLHGGTANKLIVSARVSGGDRDHDGIQLFIVDADGAGVASRSYKLQDGTPASNIAFSGARAEMVLGTPSDGMALIDYTIDTAIAALSGEALGAMGAALDVTVAYLKTRRQFGTEIGKFQALQHKAADMFIAVQQARSMAIFAARTIEETDPAQRHRNALALKVFMGQAGRLVGHHAVQLHGGVGVTAEFAVSHYLKRLTTLAILFGSSDHYLTELAASGGLYSAA